jgi:sulfonate transport system substrate-binding protein
MKFLNRLLSMLLVGVFASTLSNVAQADDSTNALRIGYQKFGSLIILKATGKLEKRLAPLGVTVTWTEFPAGPQMLEGLNVGSIDFAITGETPPVFAQAAGANLSYIGYEPAASAGEAIIVPKDSPIKSVAELKGKKVALNKGSNVHYLLVRALEKAGLKYSDIEPVFLKPSDARAAFERGSVDAWVIWDPFLAAAEKQIGARVVRDGKGLVNNYGFYLAEKTYASRHPDVIAATFDELTKIDKWIEKSPKDAASKLAPTVGLDVGIVELSLARGGYGVSYLNDKVIGEQQAIADTFSDLNLIPRKLNIREVVWLPEHSGKIVKE